MGIWAAPDGGSTSVRLSHWQDSGLGEGEGSSTPSHPGIPSLGSSNGLILRICIQPLDWDVDIQKWGGDAQCRGVGT